MKTYLRLVSLIATIIFPIAIWANVIVKGQVTYQNGQSANNYQVYIQTDSSATACKTTHLKYTNQNGVYQDTLVCTARIVHINVWVVNCQNNIVSHYLEVPSSGVVETNFVVCNSGICNADFTYYAIAGEPNTIRFHSETSTASSDDSIISRKWLYGDGDSAVSNSLTPDHHYIKAGYYEVCLFIKTKNGCQSSTCKTITVAQSAGTCHASFSFTEATPQPLNGYKLLFKNTSTTALNDSITGSYWNFGDNQTLNGDNLSPSHTYTGPANTTACLTIITAAGCMDSICHAVIIPQTHCHAQFNYTTISDSNFFFNATASFAIKGDTITQYHWTFGDGGTASTIDPRHSYAKPGSYQVCLKITTKAGCIDSLCQFIIIIKRGCQARFTYLPVTDSSNNIARTIHFNGLPSIAGTGDSLIHYYWTFGDSGIASTIDPYHTYTKPGNYLACLTVVSKTGCRDSMCTNIVIAGPPPTTCSAYFNFTDTGLNGHFNSAQINISAGDSITTRSWSFGDGQTLTGNVVAPLHRYKYGGSYQVCLEVKTRFGCASEYCKIVHIAGDSIVSSPDFVRIISVYPNPASTQSNAIIYSKYNNVDATLGIYDVYGVLKWSTQKVLSAGNVSITIPISQLANGPYILKLTTIYGVSSIHFFKL